MQTRQARIRKLHNQLYPSLDEKGPIDSFRSYGNIEPLYFIGKSQNQPVNLSHFIRLNSNDLATKVGISVYIESCRKGADVTLITSPNRASSTA